MTVVLNDNFAGTPGTPFAADGTYTLLNGTPQYVASIYGSAVRFTSAQATLNYSVTAFTGPRAFSRIYKLSAAPGGGSNSEIFQIRAAPSGASNALRAYLTPTGNLRIQNGANSAFTTSTSPVPIGSEFRVTYTINSAGTQFTAAIFPDTSSTTATQTLSITVTATSVDTIREGNITPGLTSATLDLIWPEDDNAGTDPGPRVYVSCSLSPTTGAVPISCTATATVVNSPAGTKAWTFHWGDGTANTGPQGTASSTHTYTTAGSYSVTVDLDVS